MKKISTLKRIKNKSEALKPSELTLKNILGFSKAYQAKKSKSISQIEMMLN